MPTDILPPKSLEDVFSCSSLPIATFFCQLPLYNMPDYHFPKFASILFAGLTLSFLQTSSLQAQGSDSLASRKKANLASIVSYPTPYGHTQVQQMLPDSHLQLHPASLTTVHIIGTYNRKCQKESPEKRKGIQRCLLGQRPLHLRPETSRNRQRDFRLPAALPLHHERHGWRRPDL